MKGDLVINKQVEYEVANVEPGAIGIQINHGPMPTTDAPTPIAADKQAEAEAPEAAATVEAAAEHTAEKPAQQPSSGRAKILSELMSYAERGDWQGAASVERVQRFIRQILGVGDTPLSPAEQAQSKRLWGLLEGGRGPRPRIIMQNLIGFFIWKGWLAAGSPHQNEAFFGTRDGYSNIDKGKPGGEASKDFQELYPLLEHWSA